MTEDFEKYLYDEYEEIAEELLSMGIDNKFKLESLENLDVDSLKSDMVIKLSYINYSEKFSYPEVDYQKWTIASSHLDKLKRANYSENDYYKILGKFFKNKEEYNSFLIWSKHNMENKKTYGHKNT